MIYIQEKITLEKEWYCILKRIKKKRKLNSEDPPSYISAPEPIHLRVGTRTCLNRDHYTMLILQTVFLSASPRNSAYT